MKRFLALIAAVILFGGTFSVSAATTSKTALLPTNIPKAFPLTKQDPSFTKIEFWHAQGSPIGGYLNDIVNWYNSTEGKKAKTYVKTIYQGDYDAITIKLQATLQANNIKSLPDLVQLSSQGAFSVKDSKNIIYMEDLIKADPSFKVTDKFDPCAMYYVSYKGRQLGMPFANSVIVNFYNKTAFKAVGLDPANSPKTMDEYVDAVKKLMIKGTGAKPKRYGSVNKVYTYQFTTWVSRMKNGTAHEFDMGDGHLGVPTKLICAEDGTLKATLAAWDKAMKTGGVNYNSNSRTVFTIGQACMFSGSTTGYEIILDTLKTEKDPAKRFDVGMGRLPVVNADDVTAEAPGGNALFMFDKVDDIKKQKTWSFVKFLTSKDVSAYWYVKSGYFPLNSDALNTTYVQDLLKKLPEKKVPLQIRADSAKYYTIQEPWIPSQAVYNNLISDQCSLLGDGKITVDQAVANIAKKANSLLKTYHEANGK